MAEQEKKKELFLPLSIRACLNVLWKPKQPPAQGPTIYITLQFKTTFGTCMYIPMPHIRGLGLLMSFKHWKGRLWDGRYWDSENIARWR